MLDTELTPDQSERALLAGILAEPSALRFATEHVTPHDFADVKLGALFSKVVGMHATGQPTDAYAVAAACGASTRGLPAGSDVMELHSLLIPGSTVAWHAQRVRSNAVLREVSTAGHRMHLAATKEDADASQVVATAMADLTSIREGSTTGPASAPTLGEVLDEPLDYDWIVPGLLESQDRFMLTGGEGGGKALALDTPIPTPKGWATMGELTVGQEVFGADGTPVRVSFATEVMHGRDCFRVTFSDGATITADADHLWLTETLSAREAHAAAARRSETKLRGTDQRHKRTAFPEVVTTKQIRDTLMARGGHAVNHAIPTCAPLQYPAQELPIHPYALGAWLGDGTSASAGLTCDDPDLVEELRSLGEPVKHYEGIRYAFTDGVRTGRAGKPGSFRVRLRGLGVLGNKHIPDAYQHASVSQRLALLQGLMDTDGTVQAKGSGAAKCEFSVVSEPLARGVHELLLGLGVKAVWRESLAKLYGRVVGLRYRLQFQTDLQVFRLPRKAERMEPMRTRRSTLRYITAVDPVPSVPVRCIQVESEDHLYVAGRECIPTHNTTLLRQMAVMINAGLHPFTAEPIEPVDVLYIDVENTRRQWARNAGPLAGKAAHVGVRDPRQHLHLECRGRLDLRTERDLGLLHRFVDEHKPQVLVIGPLYKLVGGAINSDDDAAPLLAALDSLRERGLVLLMEAHAGHGQTADGVRNLRPRGSSALLGWPEFGYGISRDPELETRSQLVRWRGDRDQRDWPEWLVRGGAWPWTDQEFQPGRATNPYRAA